MGEKRFGRLVLIIVFICGAIGCDEDKSSCKNEQSCEIESQVRCNGQTVQICSAREDGCLTWQDQTDCADAGMTCSMDAGTTGCLCVISSVGGPENPLPEGGIGGVDVTTTEVDWDDVDGALSYDVYFGPTCPPPAYPDPAFQKVASPELTGLTLVAETTYCWQVIALADDDCHGVGPAWYFTTHCSDDPVPGFPEVISELSVSYPSNTTEEFYLLQFSEEVNRVGQAIRMTPVNGGSGTYAGTKRVEDSQTDFRANFEGVASGDVYTLTVGTNLIDACGKHPVAPTEITIEIE
ncbi:MAG: hypothetical protein GY762_16420 [Proteobacteria bacterium]|nr:hypothetical protein [Pseudomonadota bacterium]